MLTKQQSIAAIAVGLAAICAALWEVMRPVEPSYDGRTLTQWMGVLGSSDSDEEAHAFAAIEAIGTNGLPIIIEFLGRKDSAEWHQRAKLALILAGAEAEHASIPALVRLSQHSDPDVRLKAVELLSGVVSSEPAALPALEACQSDAYPKVRAAAQQAIGTYKAVEKAVKRHAKDQP
jgi:HEAT repeat protein